MKHFHCNLLTVSVLATTLLWETARADPHKANPVRMYFQSLDRDYDQTIPTVELARVLWGVRLDDEREEVMVQQRWLARAMSMDGDGDGLVTLPEFQHWVEGTMVQMYTDRLLGCDVDGKPGLSLTEYALAVPDARGKRKENGVTYRQSFGFKRMDADENATVSRDEVEDYYRTQRMQNYASNAIVNQLWRADTDEDDHLNLKEYAAVFASDAAVFEEVEEQFESLRPKDGLVSRERVRSRYRNASEEQILATEVLLDAWDIRQRLDQSSARLVDRCDHDEDGAISFDEYAAMRGFKELRAIDVQILAPLDANQDQKITQREVIEGLQQLIDVRFVARTMAVDADSDGVLSAREYALSIPDPNGTVHTSGLTTRQQDLFERNDLDGNGEIAVHELELPIMRAMLQRVEANVVMLWMFQFDSDSNGILSPAEYLTALSGASAAEQEGFQQKYLEWTEREQATSGLNREQLDRLLSIADQKMLRRFVFLSQTEANADS